MTPDHAPAWKCSGVTHDAAPAEKDISGERHDWPADELHGGIAHVSIQYHGDDISAAYLSVAGTDLAAVRECWRRTAALFPLDIWP